MTRQHARSILAAEYLVRQTIPDDLGAWDEECPQKTATLRKDFRAFVRMAENRHQSLKADLEGWRARVASGEREFERGEELEYRQSLSALVSFASLLVEKYEAYRRRGILLHAPRVAEWLLARKREFEKSLRDWKTPEWEVTDERVVRWDKEQTRYLLARLGSPPW